jgi:very-short-patch-repair endonuclease
MTGHEPFIGSEAIANGTVRRHQLRSRFRRELPDVYVRRDGVLTLQQRSIAAWQWSHRQGVLAGLTASAWHGSKWVDSRLPIEMIWRNARPPRGVRTYDMQLLPGERVVVAGVPVTTPQRTAFDIGRRKPLDSAVANLDSLMRATTITADEVYAVAEQHRGARGLRQLETALGLVDTGSQSPRETWLRLLLLRAGLPRPTTQIPVTTERAQVYYLDMGWEDLLVAVEYDGEHHRTDRWQYTKDNHRRETLERLGWIVIRVTVTDRPENIIGRVRDALDYRESSLR